MKYRRVLSVCQYSPHSWVRMLQTLRTLRLRSPRETSPHGSGRGDIPRFQRGCDAATSQHDRQEALVLGICYLACRFHVFRVSGFDHSAGESPPPAGDLNFAGWIEQVASTASSRSGGGSYRGCFTATARESPASGSRGGPRARLRDLHAECHTTFAGAPCATSFGPGCLRRPR